MVHNTQIRVYYEDTDMGGVVYYANYLKFLERGRSDAVREAGISQLEMRDAGLVFVVRRVEADYLRPARFEDLLRVQTTLEDMRGARFTMPQTVWRGEEKLLDARIDCAVMDMSGRAARLPAEIRRKLAVFMG